jgi:biotin transport system substrate-specific component
MYNTQSRTAVLTRSALFIAVTAICSWISIPIPGTSVPINLATFAVILAGLVLGPKDGPISIIVFLALGAIGIPVFHSFTGGMGVVFGPTGGFLIGYIFLALLAGIGGAREKNKIANYILFTLIGEVLLYAFGSAWFIFQAGSNVQTALLSCVVPFIPGDILKMILAYFVASRIHHAFGA